MHAYKSRAQWDAMVMRRKLSEIVWYKGGVVWTALSFIEKKKTDSLWSSLLGRLAVLSSTVQTVTRCSGRQPLSSFPLSYCRVSSPKQVRRSKLLCHEIVGDLCRVGSPACLPARCSAQMIQYLFLLSRICTGAAQLGCDLMRFTHLHICIHMSPVEAFIRKLSHGQQWVSVQEWNIVIQLRIPSGCSSGNSPRCGEEVGVNERVNVQ